MWVVDARRCKMSCVTCVKKAHITFLVVFVVWAATSGCAGLSRMRGPHIDSPTIEVGEVRLVDQTAEGARVQLTVVLVNPNPTALPLVTNAYRVTVAGKTFAFTESVRRTLPAQGRQTLTLSAAFATGNADMAGAAYRVTGSVEYHPPGQLRRIMYDSGVPRPTVGYATSGKLGQRAQSK